MPSSGITFNAEIYIQYCSVLPSNFPILISMNQLELTPEPYKLLLKSVEY